MTQENLIHTAIFLCVLLLINIATYIKNPALTVSFDQRDIAFFCGILLTGIGAWMVYEPSGLIISGLMLFWTARPR